MIQVSSVRVYNTWHVCCVVCGHNPAKPPSVTIRLTPTPTPTPGHHWPVVQVQEVLSVLFMFCFRVYIPHVSDFTCFSTFPGTAGETRPAASPQKREPAPHSSARGPIFTRFDVLLDFCGRCLFEPWASSKCRVPFPSVGRFPCHFLLLIPRLNPLWLWTRLRDFSYLHSLEFIEWLRRWVMLVNVP